MLDEFLIVVFLTYQDDPVMVLNDMFWTASRRLQSRFEIRPPQAGPAYGRFGMMYSL